MKAWLQEKLPDGKNRCLVCAHRCELSEGALGICRVRQNVGGEIRYLAADRMSSVCPFVGQCGADTYCANQPGCNWSCSFCVTSADTLSELDATIWDSKDDLPMTEDGFLDKAAVRGRGLKPLPLTSWPKKTPAQVVAEWKASGQPGFAIRSTEPSIHVEAVAKIAQGVHDGGGFVMLGTNGYWTPELVDILGPLIDLASVGLKASGNRQFLRKVSGVPDPAPIFETIEGLLAHDVILEVSDIPLYHRDWRKEFGELCSFVAATVPARDYPRLRLRPWGGRVPFEAFGHFRVGAPFRIQEANAGVTVFSRPHLLLNALEIALGPLESIWVDSGHLTDEERTFLVDEIPHKAEEGSLLRVAQSPEPLASALKTEPLKLDWQRLTDRAQLLIDEHPLGKQVASGTG